MTRRILPATLALTTLCLVPGLAWAESQPQDVTCSAFLAMDDEGKDAVAAVVESELAVEMADDSTVDLAVLRDAGIDPSAAEPPLPPLPGETVRVLTEACAARGAFPVMQALTAQGIAMETIDDQG